MRKALLDGDLELANDFMGRPFSISGMVVSGQQKGTELGFPTANLGELDPYKLVPKIGVYAVKSDNCKRNPIWNVKYRYTSYV